MIFNLPKLQRSLLILITSVINNYALLPGNVSFLECFKRPHIYFIKYFSNPTEITQNHFCRVFLKNHKHLREVFLRRLKDVTKRTSFLRCIWDVLKMSQKSRVFWYVSERSLKCLSRWRSHWDLSETSNTR